MKLSFLGTASGHPSSSRQHTAVLVKSELGTLLLDCGAEVNRFLKQQGLSADIVDGVWLSHAHSDHVGNFSHWIQALWLQKRKRELAIYASSGLVKILKKELENRLLFSELLGFSLQWHEIVEGEILACRSLRLKGFATTHLDRLRERFLRDYPEVCFDCYGVTFESEGKRLAYSADMAKPEDLEKIWSQPVDGLICEMAHFSPESLFEYLAAKPLKKVWLIHHGDNWAEQEDQLQDLAQKSRLTAEVKLAREGQSVTI
ncbi:MAG: MBL fold metallo-hydrolase [Verrucomicrobiae bacterium]|nr:MBL fold metallo-hydrolase [Verrucomicrobiae bacterium]